MQAQPLLPRDLAGGFTVSTSGSYELTGSVSFLGKTGLTVAASGVLLDLGGHCLTGDAAAPSLLTVASNVTHVRIRDGSVLGGQRCLVVEEGAREVALENLHFGGFAFAGVVLEAARNVTLRSCLVGRATSAPWASLFGVVALPRGGFPAAAKLLAGRVAREGSSGRGLRLERLSVADITPLPSAADEAFPASRWADPQPSIVDTGFRINTSCAYPVLPQGLGLSHSLARRSEVTGAARLAPPLSSAPQQYPTVTNAGVHALALIGWWDIEGAPSATSLSEPSVLPPRFRLPLDSEEPLVWAARSAFLHVAPAKAEMAAADLKEEGEVAQVPLGVRWVSSRTASRPVGPFLPGASGSYVAW